MSCKDSLSDNSEELEYINPADWVELFNPTDKPIAIGSWSFKDGNNEHKFDIPENQVLDAGEYLVLCEDSLAFNNNFPNVSNFIGEFAFGLNGGGELVRLFDVDGNIVDVVDYDDSEPWPLEPDGNGPTLELIHPALDNGLGENWAASDKNGGTPGTINTVYTVNNSASIASGIVINEINYNAPDE
ncbi:MAG: lamin tail domain-containing protein [Candidatus Marinimicrobia bacterium]|nr:lamin tail domain-containing protein [Candidatus Neomarinimicrobiota bacterium]